MAHRFPGISGAGVASRGGVYGVLKTNEGMKADDSRNNDDDSPNTNSMVHMGLSLLHVLVAGTAFAISITCLVFALGVSCNNSECKTLGYLTSTFATSSKIGTQTGWAVATERAKLSDAVQYPAESDEFVFSHYYECMSDARMADKLCPRTDPLGEYITCLHNYTSNALDTCNYLSSSVSQPWPTPDEYLDCLFGFKELHNSVNVRASKNVFRTCVSKTMWPFFEVQQGIDSPLLLGSFNWLVMMTVGLWLLTSFAVYSVSPIEAGDVTYGDPVYYKRLGWAWACVSIAWNLLVLVLLLVLIFRDLTIFEDSDKVVPMTLSTAGLCLVALVAAVFYFGAEISEQRTTVLGAHVWSTIVDRGGGKEVVKKGHITRVPNEDEDDSDSTQLVVKHHHHHGRRELPAITPEAFAGGGRGSGVTLGGSLYNTGMVTYKITEKEAALYYTPPLLRVWADGLAFADPFIFLGVAGATGHLTTSVAWGLFFGILIYRLLGMSIARFLYQCFMNNLSLSHEVQQAYHDIVPNTRMYLHEVHHIVHSHVEKAKKRWRGERREESKEEKEAAKIKDYGDTPHLSIAVMALSTQFSAILILVVVAYLALAIDSPILGFGLFTTFIYVCFVVPEIIRTLFHLWLQVSHTDPSSVPWNTLNLYFFVWIWDVLTRAIFICIVVVGPGSTPGTRHFLMDNSIALMDTYLTAFKVY